MVRVLLPAAGSGVGLVSPHNGLSRRGGWHLPAARLVWFRLPSRRVIEIGQFRSFPAREPQQGCTGHSSGCRYMAADRSKKAQQIVFHVTFPLFKASRACGVFRSIPSAQSLVSTNVNGAKRRASFTAFLP